MTKQIRWIVQNNLTNETDFNKIKNACNERGYEFQGIKVIPFSDELPIFSIDSEITNIYYGSTSFIFNLWNKLKPEGLFFDDEAFTMENYIHYWKHYMLNNVAIKTFEEFVNENYLSDKIFFIRPNNDSKCFSGTSALFGHIKHWYDSFKDLNLSELNPNTKILATYPRAIDKEWRCVIINGKVIESSLYRENFILKKNRNDKPQEMIKFVENRCKEYAPHKIFVMDIGLVNDEYKIIECNCFNGSGFYDCDIENIVSQVSQEMSKE